MKNIHQAIIDKIESYPEEHLKEVLESLDRLEAKKLAESEKLYTLADLDDILPQISWLWEPWLPKGFLTLLVGEPGIGKSALALAIAQCFLQKKPWPDGQPSLAQGNLAVWADTESSHAITRERALDWEVPRDRLSLPIVGKDLLGSLRLDTQEGWWAMLIEAHRKDVGLIIIDSLRGSYHGDENRSEVATFMKKLAELATRTQVPILVIHHLRKRNILDGQNINLDQVRGSSAIAQMVRCIWAIDKPNEHLTTLRCQQIKNNLARFPDPFGFEITDDGIAYTDPPTTPMPDITPRDEIKDWLLELLKDGPVLTSIIYEQAENWGFSKTTVRRAKRELGIQHTYQDGEWFWQLT